MTISFDQARINGDSDSGGLGTNIIEECAQIVSQDESDSNERTRASVPEDSSRVGEEFQKDQLLGGRYRVLSVLGKGGMGVVYRVEQIFLSKEFALKTIDKRLMSDKTIRRFQHEARASFAVNHPNIISVNDFGLLDDDTPFLAMEIVTGETLAARLKRSGALSVAEAVPIFVQICFALAHAHSQGVVHRDIKPSNIMLLDNVPPGGEGSVKLLDFGIAKFTHNEASDVQELTRTGEVFGSPLYMSPEQCSGSKVDHRADVYSLGCVMFEALTGTPPFPGENALTTIIMHQSEPPPSLKEASLGEEFPPELERIVSTMLAKNPDDRFQNLGKLAHNLALLVRGEPLKLSARAPVAKVENNPNTITLDRRVFYGLLTGVAVLAAVLTAAVFHFGPVSKRKESPTGSQTKQSTTSNLETELDGLFADRIKTRQCRFKAGVFVNDRILKCFKGYTEAQILEVTDCSVTDKGLGNLRDSKLINLNVSGSDVSSVDNISHFEYLQFLDLKGTPVNDSALPKLAQLKMLNQLGLQGCKKLTPKGLEALVASTSLLTVYLPGEIATPQVIESLRNRMPGCRFPPYHMNSKFQEFIYNWKGSPYEAFEQCYLKARKINPLSDSCGFYLGEMAQLRAKQANVVEAARLFEQERDVFEKNGNRARLAGTFLRGAAIACAMGELKRAVELSDEAEKLFKETLIKDDPQAINTFEALCAIAAQAQDKDRVIKHCEDALAVLDRFYKDPNPYRTAFLERAGWCYHLKGQKEKALARLKQFLAYVEKPENKADRGDIARANIEVAHCLTDPILRKQHYNKGLKIIEQLNFPKERNLRDHYCDACFSAAQVCVGQRDYKNASTYMERAISIASLVKSDIRVKTYKEYMQNQILTHIQSEK